MPPSTSWAVTHNRSPEGLTMDWEYLLLIARKNT